MDLGIVSLGIVKESNFGQQLLQQYCNLLNCMHLLGRIGVFPAFSGSSRAEPHLNLWERSISMFQIFCRGTDNVLLVKESEIHKEN